MTENALHFTWHQFPSQNLMFMFWYNHCIVVIVFVEQIKAIFETFEGYFLEKGTDSFVQSFIFLSLQSPDSIPIWLGCPF